MKTRNLIRMSIMVALFLGFSVSASAGLIFNISDDNNPGGYGNVEFANDGDGVKFTITSESSLFDKFYFNLDNPINVGDISILSKGKWKVTTNKKASNFGEFDYLIQGKRSNDPLRFLIAGISLPSDPETLFVANSNHGKALFAGHLQGGGNSYVGRIANPIPGAIWLLGSGLVGLVVVRRRVRK